MARKAVSEQAGGLSRHSAKTTSMTARYVGRSASDELNSCANRQSLIELYGVLRPSLHTYVCSLGLRQDRAEDVIQESFLRLVRHTMRFGTYDNLRAWAFRVARNISVDFQGSGIVYY